MSTPALPLSRFCVVIGSDGAQVQVSDKLYRALKKFVEGRKHGRVEIDFKAGDVAGVRIMETL